MFSGVGVALITPFNEKLQVDFDRLEALVELAIKNKVDYLVVNGTTSEASTLSRDEKKQILSFVAKVNNKRVPLVFGIGTNETELLLQMIKDIDFTFVDAILVVSPYYNKPSQRGIIAHYELVAKASPRPIIMYNIPSRTGSNMTAETILHLANNPNIIGIKEASGDFLQYLEIIKNRPKGFLLISGDDMLTQSMIALGGEGVISVLANAFGGYIASVHSALNGDFKQATEQLKPFIGFNNLLYEEGNPVGIKEALKHKGVVENYVRLPLLSASEELSNAIKEILPE